MNLSAEFSDLIALSITKYKSLLALTLALLAKALTIGSVIYVIYLIKAHLLLALSPQQLIKLVELSTLLLLILGAYFFHINYQKNQKIQSLNKHIESLTTYSPHLAGLLEKDGFFYCQSHPTPALFGLVRYEENGISFKCTNCNKDWSFQLGSPNIPPPKTHIEACEQFRALPSKPINQIDVPPNNAYKNRY